jgi:hypothetical protein
VINITTNKSQEISVTLITSNGLLFKVK